MKNKKTLLRCMALAICLVLMLGLLAGCGGGSTSGGAASGGAASGGAASGGAASGGAASGGAASGGAASGGASDEKFHFNVSYSTPEQNSVGITDALKRIEEKSNGRVTFTHYFTWALSSIPTIVDDLRTGLVDFGIVPLNMHQSVLPHTAVAEVPFLGYPSSLDIAQGYEEAMEAFPIMRDEYTNAGLVYYTCFAQPPYYLWTGGVDPIRTPADLRGKRIVVSDVPVQKLVDASGGAAVSMPWTDLAVAMSTGVADGGIMHVNTMRAFGALDFADTGMVMEGGFVTGVMGLAFSKQKWDQLPADIQQLFLDEAENMRDDQTEFNLKMAEGNDEWFTGEHGAQFVPLTDAEAQSWKDAVAPYVQEFVDEMEKMGASQAKEVYAAVSEIANRRAGR